MTTTINSHISFSWVSLLPEDGWIAACSFFRARLRPLQNENVNNFFNDKYSITDDLMAGIFVRPDNVLGTKYELTKNEGTTEKLSLNDSQFQALCPSMFASYERRLIICTTLKFTPNALGQFFIVSKVIARLLRFSFFTLRDWLAKLAPLSQPMRSKTKTNRASLVQVFPRFHTPVTCICFETWLAHCVVYVCCDWPE